MKIRKSIPNSESGFSLQETILDESRCFEGVISLPLSSMNNGTEYLINMEPRRVITRACPPDRDCIPEELFPGSDQPICTFSHYLIGRPFIIHELIGAAGPLGYLCIPGSTVEMDPSADELGHTEAGLRIYFNPTAERMTFLETERYEELLTREVLPDDLVCSVRKAISLLKESLRKGSFRELVSFSPPARK